MEKELNQIVSWLRDFGISAKIISYELTTRKHVYFEVCFGEFEFVGNTNVLTVFIEPYLLKSEPLIHIKTLGQKDFDLEMNKESIRILHDKIINEWANKIHKHIDSIEYAKTTIFKESHNILCSKQIGDNIVKSIVCNLDSAIAFFGNHTNILMIREIANIDVNSDSFYDLLFPNLDKVEVQMSFAIIARNSCEKPENRENDFSEDIPNHIKEQRELFIETFKYKLLLLEIKRLLNQ